MGVCVCGCVGLSECLGLFVYGCVCVCVCLSVCDGVCVCECLSVCVSVTGCVCECVCLSLFLWLISVILSFLQNQNRKWIGKLYPNDPVGYKNYEPHGIRNFRKTFDIGD